MFHKCIVDGKKGSLLFWEREWGNMNSSTYHICVLRPLTEFMHENPQYIFMQDNALSYRLKATKQNLERLGIPFLKWPPYSLDLNLIEHVWNWMKTWIQEKYWQARYDVQ